MGKFLKALYDDLSLYVRQSAWLNAIVERAKNDPPEAPRLSRLEHLRKKKDDPNYSPDMPEIEAAEYLIDYLWEVGPVESSGGYSAPVTHREISCWCELTGVPLEPWEVRCVRALSQDYLNELRRAEKPGCPEPVREISALHDSVSVIEQAEVLKNQIRELAKL